MDYEPTWRLLQSNLNLITRLSKLISCNRIVILLLLAIETFHFQLLHVTKSDIDFVCQLKKKKFKNKPEFFKKNVRLKMPTMQLGANVDEWKEKKNKLRNFRQIFDHLTLHGSSNRFKKKTHKLGEDTFQMQKTYVFAHYLNMPRVI